MGKGNLGGILRDNLGEGNCESKIAGRQWGSQFLLRGIKMPRRALWVQVFFFCNFGPGEPGDSCAQRAQRSKKLNLAQNLQSRSKCLIALEKFNLDVSISPPKNRAAVGGALENFILARNLRDGFWQNGFFADFYFWAAGFFRGFCRRVFFFLIFVGKVPRKILQENPRQNPPKLIQQKSPTTFCRGAGRSKSRVFLIFGPSG